MKALHVLLLGGFAAAGSLAAQSSADPSASARAGPPAPEPRICRRVSAVGSRLGGERACHTAAEWAELRRQTRATIEHVQTNRPWNALCTKASGAC